MHHNPCMSMSMSMGQPADVSFLLPGGDSELLVNLGGKVLYPLTHPASSIACFKLQTYLQLSYAGQLLAKYYKVYLELLETI